MFRIRRIHDDVLPANREALLQVQVILRAQFPAIPAREVDLLPEKLRNPLKYRFRSILLVAENANGTVQGFALLMHAPDLDFSYLDFVSAGPRLEGRGIGGALYERVRTEAAALGAKALLFECLPDDSALSRDAAIRRQNVSRLRFYEHYGARPVVGTRYETPLREGGDNPPYLVVDTLGLDVPLRRDAMREMVRAILDRKYGPLCPRDYVDMVVESFQDEPVRLREPHYVRSELGTIAVSVAPERRIALVVTDQHEIHHVRERGYVESPVRIRSIVKELDRTDLFVRHEPRHFSERHLLSVHDGDFVRYLRRVCDTVPAGSSVYPYVFPIRNVARPPKELAVRAGYYCIDTFTPINRAAFTAAERAVDCALTAVDHLLHGARLAYALVRPPGHHAERRSFGGFCYFNSTAIAAHTLSVLGRVAILDLDYHHGNGQQDIFYTRGDVLTVSIHGHPSFAYPYFSGFEDEKGSGDGLGLNVNMPLAESLEGAAYLEALRKLIARIGRFRPRYLVVALGLDTAKGDPTGTWSLGARDFKENGRLVGAMRLPTLVVQEGGYDNRVIGVNARNFFAGLWAGHWAA